MPCCGPNGCCKCPPKDEAIRTLKGLFSAAMGMIAALSLNDAMEATFKEIGDFAVAVYAILISLISIYSIAAIKLKLEVWAKKPGFGDKGTAILGLFKIAFCLLSASAWKEVINPTGKEYETTTLLLIATLLTIMLIALLIFAFKLKQWWDSSSCCCSCRPKLPGFIQTLFEWFLVGFVAWIPVTFGIVGGIAWNEFFETAIKSLFGDSETSLAEVAVAFVYALLTIPIAIAIVLITHRVANNGCCINVGCCGKPCFGLENKIADPLAGMFEGEAAALLAFAWEGAVQSAFNYVTLELGDGETAVNTEGGGQVVKKHDGDMSAIWLYAIYAVVAVTVGVLAVLYTKKCTR